MEQGGRRWVRTHLLVDFERDGGNHRAAASHNHSSIKSSDRSRSSNKRGWFASSSPANRKTNSRTSISDNRNIKASSPYGDIDLDECGVSDDDMKGHQSGHLGHVVVGNRHRELASSAGIKIKEKEGSVTSPPASTSSSSSKEDRERANWDSDCFIVPAHRLHRFMPAMPLQCTSTTTPQRTQRQQSQTSRSQMGPKVPSEMSMQHSRSSMVMSPDGCSSSSCSSGDGPTMSVMRIDNPSFCVVLHFAGPMKPSPTTSPSSPLCPSPTATNFSTSPKQRQQLPPSPSIISPTSPFEQPISARAAELALLPVQQAALKAALGRVKSSGAATTAMLLTCLERDVLFPFIVYVVLDGTRVQPRTFLGNYDTILRDELLTDRLREGTNHFSGYEEVATIARPPIDILPRKSNPQQQQSSKTGYIISVFKVFPGEDREKLERSWLLWTGARLIYKRLPKCLGLRRLTFHKKLWVDGNGITYALLCECSSLLDHVMIACSFVEQLRARCCGHSALYKCANSF